jgi:putative acetyltransferase
MNIRLINDDDFPVIFDIYAQSKLDELRFETRHFELLPLEYDEVRLAELKESDIYIYEDEDENVVGYGALCGLEIRALFVLPSARGRGVGRNLLEFLLRKAVGGVILYVAKTNTPAKQLYQHYGFKVISEFETQYNGMPVFANKMVRN